MKQFTEWFNGKKTVIGAVLMAVTFFLYKEDIINENAMMLAETLGSLIFTVGVGHKVGKGVKKKREKDEKVNTNPPIRPI